MCETLSLKLLSYLRIWVISAPALSQGYLFHFAAASQCMASMWVFGGWRAKGEGRVSAWSPSSHFLLLPHRRSKTARPGSPVLPLNHLPCPRSCQDLPPQRLWAAIAAYSPTQHPAPSTQSQAEAACQRGSVFQKVKERKAPYKLYVYLTFARVCSHTETHIQYVCTDPQANTFNLSW